MLEQQLPQAQEKDKDIMALRRSLVQLQNAYSDRASVSSPEPNFASKFFSPVCQVDDSQSQQAPTGLSLVAIMQGAKGSDQAHSGTSATNNTGSSNIPADDIDFSQFLQSQEDSEQHTPATATPNLKVNSTSVVKYVAGSQSQSPYKYVESREEPRNSVPSEVSSSALRSLAPFPRSRRASNTEDPSPKGSIGNGSKTKANTNAPLAKKRDAVTAGLATYAVSSNLESKRVLRSGSVVVDCQTQTRARQESPAWDQSFANRPSKLTAGKTRKGMKIDGSITITYFG